SPESGGMVDRLFTFWFEYLPCVSFGDQRPLGRILVACGGRALLPHVADCDPISAPPVTPHSADMRGARGACYPGFRNAACLFSGDLFFDSVPSGWPRRRSFPGARPRERARCSPDSFALCAITLRFHRAAGPLHVLCTRVQSQGKLFGLQFRWLLVRRVDFGLSDRFCAAEAELARNTAAESQTRRFHRRDQLWHLSLPPCDPGSGGQRESAQSDVRFAGQRRIRNHFVLLLAEFSMV